MSALYKYALQKPWVRDLIEKRISALRAVRGAGHQETAGAEMAVRSSGENIVKNALTNNDITKRRGFLKDALHEQGLAPETFMVETSKNKYLVQPRGSTDTTSWEKITEAQKAANELKERAWRGGFEGLEKHPGMDINYGNIGKFGPEWKILDSGRMEYHQPMDRKSALEKFVSYGRRDKPWLK